jgi:hypothetical protein
MDLTELALDVDKSFAITMGWAEGDAQALDTWLHKFMPEERWREQIEVPSREPDAVSLDGDGEPSYNWYQTEAGVVGVFVLDGLPCYLIPAGIDEFPPVEGYEIPPLPVIPGRGR